MSSTPQRICNWWGRRGAGASSSLNLPLPPLTPFSALAGEAEQALVDAVLRYHYYIEVCVCVGGGEFWVVGILNRFL